MKFTKENYIKINTNNIKMEIYAKLREISATINMGVKLPALQDHVFQLYEIQRNTYFFYSDFIKVIEDSKAGLTSDEKKRETLQNYEDYEKFVYQRYWQLIRSIINQRANETQHQFLKVGDSIAQSLYDVFLENEKLEQIRPLHFTYSKPLTFLGPFNRYEYYTIFPKFMAEYNFNIPIISVSRSASGAIWYLQAVPHEIGHDIMGNVSGFEEEMNAEVNSLFERENFNLASIKMPVLSEDRKSILLKEFNSKELMKTIWTSYLSEAFADLIAVLYVGPSFLLSSIELLGLSKFDAWQYDRGGPEVHPSGYLRTAIQTYYLEKVGFENTIKDILELRNSLSPTGDYKWENRPRLQDEPFNFTLSADKVEESARKFVDALDEKTFPSLGGNKIRDLIKPFDNKDQESVEQISEMLRAGDSTIKETDFDIELKPKHILAASRWAASQYPQKAASIHDSALKIMLRNFQGT